jgi:hypothetical protein
MRGGGRFEPEAELALDCGEEGGALVVGIAFEGAFVAVAELEVVAGREACLVDEGAASGIFEDVGNAANVRKETERHVDQVAAVDVATLRSYWSIPMRLDRDDGEGEWLAGRGWVALKVAADGGISFQSA